ncbi:Gfo/Idh/MocA family protein (plasmid) [Haloferacaceae archaeon DSL9]
MALRTAVVGAGVVSNRHLPGLQDCPKTELVAICDLDEERAREQARKYSIKAYFDLDELLASEDLDWVHICTPLQTHFALAKTVIEAGVPVLIEKPVAESVEEVEELMELSEEHGVPVTGVHNHKYDMAMRRGMKSIADGDIGRIRGVDLMYTGSTSPDVPNRGSWAFDLVGGEFEEGIPHPLYIGITAAGYPRSEADINAITSLFGDYEYDFGYDSAQVQYVSEEGVLCNIKMLSGTKPVRILYVHGEEGAIAVDFISQTMVKLDRDYKASPRARAQNNLDQIYDRFMGTVDNVAAYARTQRSGDWESRINIESMYHQFDLEAQAIMVGDDPAVPLEEIKWTTALMEAIREHARSHADDIEADLEAEAKAD